MSDTLFDGVDAESPGHPTMEMLRPAVMRVLETCTIGDLLHSREKQELVRFYLGLVWSNYPLPTLARQIHNGSKQGLFGKRDKPEKTMDEICEVSLAKLIAAYPPSQVHSDEYYQIHESDEFKTLKRRLNDLYGYICQSCSCQFNGVELHGHIVDYARWRDPGMVLMLCGECHVIIDSLRRRGVSRMQNTNERQLF